MKFLLHVDDSRDSLTKLPRFFSDFLDSVFFKQSMKFSPRCFVAIAPLETCANPAEALRIF